MREKENEDFMINKLGVNKKSGKIPGYACLCRDFIQIEILSSRLTMFWGILINPPKLC